MELYEFLIYTYTFVVYLTVMYIISHILKCNLYELIPLSVIGCKIVLYTYEFTGDKLFLILGSWGELFIFYLLFHVYDIFKTNKNKDKKFIIERDFDKISKNTDP